MKLEPWKEATDKNKVFGALMTDLSKLLITSVTTY